MPAINENFLSKLHELNTIAFACGIHWPELTQLLDRTMKENASQNLPDMTAGSFENAIFAAVSAAGANGIAAPQLQTIAQQWNQKPATVGATLGRLKRAGKIAQGNNGLWSAPTGSIVNAATVQRRRQQRTPQTATRRRRAATTASTAGNQQQAAAG